MSTQQETISDSRKADDVRNGEIIAARELEILLNQNKADEINETFNNTKLGELLIDFTCSEDGWDGTSFFHHYLQEFLETEDKEKRQLSIAFNTIMGLLDRKYLKILTRGITEKDVQNLTSFGEFLNKRYSEIPSKLL